MASSDGLTSAEPAENDKLCSVCSKVDLLSLFTGPRHYSGRPEHVKPAFTKLGTLAEVRANAKCPLCRLIKFGFEQSCSDASWGLHNEAEPDPATARFAARAYRADYVQDMGYVEETTRDKVASMLCIYLQPSESTRRLFTGESWIQLHSPDSFDPSRPLLNGHLVTSWERNLDLLSNWLDSCIKCHGEICHPRISFEPTVKYKLRCIHTRDRRIVHTNLGQDEYAALSYVWGEDQIRYTQLRDELVQSDETFDLPPTVPQVVEDAITICRALEIPYLWVDLYCVEQVDLDRKLTEIRDMGHIFRNSKIVLIAGCGGSSDSGLLPSRVEQLSRQSIENVQGRRYVTAAPNLIDQIHQSAWHRRAWTMQEGQLARRCAFFGTADISFLCGCGHWREALNSGDYGHDAVLPGINTSSDGWTMLSASRWLRDRSWAFSDYKSLLMVYTSRDITYESDRLHAITGCLNIITEATEVEFVNGHPLRDFHYSLLWTGEYDRPRSGFPSWSWTGWHCLQQMHDIYPMAGASCRLAGTGIGLLETKQPESCEAEMSGLLISLTEREHTKNRCAQLFADIALARGDGTITVNSYSVHFRINISPDPQANEGNYQGEIREIPPDFDSQSDTKIVWETEEEYSTPYARLRLHDQYGNNYETHYPYWYHHWPPFMLNFPRTLRGSSLQWLLVEGIEMIKILEVELLEAPDSLKPFHNVLCLGLDRRTSEARRFGQFCIPKEIWDKAGPKPMVVSIA